jgi:peptidyl-prolyl cis-trans isomerase SurA
MRIIFLSLLTVCLIVPAFPAAAGKEGIAVIVNQDAITNSDVADRMSLIAASTGMPPVPELMNKLRPQVVDMLVEEEIKLQEARRLKIDVSKEEISSGFNQIAQQNNIPPEDFRKMLESRKIRIGTMEDQIKAQLAWGKVIQKKLRPQVDVSEADIDSELDMLRGKIGNTEYRLADIYLPVTEQKKDSEVSAFAAKLVSQLRQKPELFPRVAQQFSQAPGGGNLGWISEGQLSPEIDKVLPGLQAGAINEPVKTLNGYHILLLREKRQITEETLPKREDLTQRIGMERLERLQRRYLMDLRGSAYIESRV